MDHAGPLVICLADSARVAYDEQSAVQMIVNGDNDEVLVEDINILQS